MQVNWKLKFLVTWTLYWGCLFAHITRRGTLLIATPLPFFLDSTSTYPPTLLLHWCPPTLIHLSVSSPHFDIHHPRHLPPKTFCCPQPLPLPFANSLSLSLSISLLQLLHPRACRSISRSDCVFVVLVGLHIHAN